MTSKNYVIARVEVSSGEPLSEEDIATLVGYGIEQGTAEFFQEVVETEFEPVDHPIDCTCIYCIPGA